MTSPDIDTCLQLVADSRRRRIISLLRDEVDGTTTFEELVEQLTRGEAVSTSDEPPAREQLAIELQHSHLPKLANHGVVDYDTRNGTVRYQPTEPVETVLDALPEDVSAPQL